MGRNPLLSVPEGLLLRRRSRRDRHRLALVNESWPRSHSGMAKSSMFSVRTGRSDSPYVCVVPFRPLNRHRRATM